MAESRLSIVIDSRSAEQRAQDTRRALQALEDAGVRVTTATGGVASAMGQQASQASVLTRNVNSTRGALQRMQQVQNQVRSGQKGLFQPVQAERYADSVDRAASATRRAARDYDRAGMSAAQLRQAQQQLPMQFTDIFTSLAAGQPPMQVFLQQGGQLRDVFGGIGPALRGMTRYIAGLINPLTLAAGATTALVVAFESGRDEAQQFNNTLTMTGQQSGATTDELMTLAAQMDNLASTTQNRAAAALNQVAQSGRFTADQFETVTRTAILMENATGQAIDKTIKQFGKIADDPVDAIAELNEQYNFLTVETYENIRALADSGREMEAQRVAMNEYADTMRDRASDVSENLGWIESAARGVAGAAKEMWDGLLNVGRDDTLQQEVSQIQSEIGRIEESLSEGRFSNAGGESRSRAALARLEQELAIKIGLLAQERSSAQAQERQSDAVDKQVKHDEQIDKLLEAQQTKKQRIAEIDGNIATLRQELANTESEDRRGEIEGAIQAWQDERQSVVESTEAYKANEKAAKEAAREAEKAARERQRAIEQYNSSLRSLEDTLFPVQQAQREFRQDQILLQTALLNGRMSVERYMEAWQRLEESQRNQGNWQDAYDSIGQVNKEMERGNDFAKEFGGTMSSALEDAIVNFEDLGDVARGFFEDLRRMIVRQTITDPLAGAVEETDWGGLIGNLAGSLFGGGGNAFATSYGSSSAGSFAGFAGGGWTGPGGKYEPKGVVHGEEFVVRREVVKQPGVRPMLERLNKGYANGGYVGPSSGATHPPRSSGGITIHAPITMQAQPGVSDEDARRQGKQAARGLEAEIVRVMRKQQRPGGILSKGA
ncbi:phage tail length tape measure family protein [Halomonas sp. I1]|uniref:phage tail length tape measure family protein n=1 Tax=Halomonas sp. I1 TaxID=393536 RepID=UPI0028DF1541|nr:phage tail length tape measure family protein [Halomonas sp. I1]MDT8894178.1 phage tail length tape measure family protein [Halomonas sp. I1]